MEWYANAIAVFAAAVADERSRQHAKWGVQRHPFEVWMLVLGEEVGEANKALLEARAATGLTATFDLMQFRTELIQVAAVACAVIEHIDEELAG